MTRQSLIGPPGQGRAGVEFEMPGRSDVRSIPDWANSTLSNSRSAQKCLQLLDKCNGVS